MKLFLISILAIAAMLRFWNLCCVPPSVSLDEASIGYNAYSVLKTGGDEYGEFPLISQRGYDDWRRSTYLFLTIPFITFFDLNPISIRLPAVILSISTVWATYYLVKELFTINKKKMEDGKWKMESIALLAAGFLAISPWHIYISRLGHESNACLSFLVFGVLFFLQGEKNKNKSRILISMIFFTLSMISYPSGQVFIPLFVAGLFFIFRKNLLSMVSLDKKTLILFFVFIVLLAPVFWAIFSPQALVRFRGTSTFNPEVHSEMFGRRVILWNKAVENKDIFGMVSYHRYLFPFVVFTEGYFSHLNPKWLFTNSASEPFKAPHTGLLNLWDAPLIVVGIFVLIFSKLVDPKNKKLIFLWFLLAPIPASIATQAPHAMRFYNVIPTWQIFSALGFVYIFYRFRKFSILILSAFSFVVFISALSFYKNYFVIFPKEQSASFQYALSRTMPFVMKHDKQYNKIVFSNQDNLYQSYMFFLFYSKYDPSLYQRQGGTKSGGFAEKHQFGKYEFRPITWRNESKTRGILYVGNPSDFALEENAIFNGYNLDRKVGVEVVEGVL